MNLTKIFYGSSYVGFEIMKDIDPILGPPLMFIFVTLSSILLMGSLTGKSTILSPLPNERFLTSPETQGMLSNSFSRVINHAREEYVYVYSVYVLEASTSNRLTHFYPPFNLVALIIFRPFRLFLPSDNKFRAARIVLLKATHFPIVGVIMLYELIRGKVTSDEYAGFKGPRIESSSSNGGGLGSGGPGSNNNTMSRKTSRAKMRPTSASSPRPPNRPSRMSISVYEPIHPPRDSPTRFVSGTGSVVTPTTATTTEAAAAAHDDIDAPTDVELKIAELSNKIDRLTELMLAMQREREQQHRDGAVGNTDGNNYGSAVRLRGF